MNIIESILNSCREHFISMNVDEKSSWDEVKIQIMDKEAFMAISEEQAFKMFRYVNVDVLSIDMEEM